MEEKKRPTATKAAIAKFREEHPSFTDEHLISSVENTYPKLYEDNLEVAIEIVKELYRRQEPWTDDSFIALLREMTEGRKLVRFGIEERKNARVIAKVNPFIERLYKEAQERTIYLSECPEYKDEDVKQYFEEVYADKGKTLAQKFFTLLNNRALYDTDQISGFVLPFHCYSEPNGDVVFTKNKRTKDDYDGNGHSLVSEKEVISRSAYVSNSSSKKGGCLGVVFVGLLVLSIIAFI
ncbi:hypothetical protein [Xylanibacter ruminicola]|nr:hypothetical protein [Xylanibacter ruminicola]